MIERNENTAADAFGGNQQVRDIIASRVESARRSLGWTVALLAQKVRISTEEILRLEQKKEFPTRPTLLKIFWQLGLAVDAVLANPSLTPDQERKWEERFAERGAGQVAAGLIDSSNRASLEVLLRFEAIAEVCAAENAVSESQQTLAARERMRKKLSDQSEVKLNR